MKKTMSYVIGFSVIAVILLLNLTRCWAPFESVSLNGPSLNAIEPNETTDSRTAVCTLIEQYGIADGTYAYYDLAVQEIGKPPEAAISDIFDAIEHNCIYYVEDFETWLTELKNGEYSE